MRLLDLFCGAGGAAMGSDTERAWAAGFFDGEGSVSVHRDKRPGRRLGISLSIEQTDIRPLERFKAATGWHGNVVARPLPRAPRRKRMFRIFATNESTLRVMAALWPWLSEPKREQFEAVIRQIPEDRYASA